MLTPIMGLSSRLGSLLLVYTPETIDVAVPQGGTGAQRRSAMRLALFAALAVAGFAVDLVLRDNDPVALSVIARSFRSSFAAAP